MLDISSRNSSAHVHPTALLGKYVCTQRHGYACAIFDVIIALYGRARAWQTEYVPTSLVLFLLR